MSAISHKTILVSDGGGSLDFVSPDGEILASVLVPAGLVPAGPYLALAPHGAEVQVSSGLVALNPPSGVGIQPYGKGSHETGANPDFQPMGSAERLQLEMVHTMRQLQANSKRLDAREAALSLVERIPSPVPAVAPSPEPVKAPTADPAPVVS